MYNFYAKFAKILEICKFFSENLVTEEGNIRRPGPVPKFSDLEVIALSLTAESESIDSEKWLFDCKLQEYKDCFPNLISRREYNDRRKKTARLWEASDWNQIEEEKMLPAKKWDIPWEKNSGERAI